MASLLVVIGIACIAALWVNGARKNRQRWLARLDLPGVWHWQPSDSAEPGVRGSLELSGGLSSGTYRLVEPDVEESGNWSLEGHTLQMIPTGADGAGRYEIRFFDEGKIGIDGPGRERRIYVKERTNVVPLRRRG
jgi:hypothetical protein